MNKRIMSLILAFLMLSSVLFTGCGVFGNGETTEPPTVGEDLENYAVTLSMFVVSEQPVPEKTAKLVEDAFNKITKPNFKTQVKLHFATYDEYYDVIEERVKSNEAYALLEEEHECYDDDEDGECDECGVVLASWNGGNMRNAIPASCEVVLTLPAEGIEELKSIAAKYEALYNSEYATIEEGITLTVTECEMPETVVPEEIQDNLIDVILACHNGVLRFIPTIPDTVETSSNLSIVKIEDGKAEINILARSSCDTMKEFLALQLSSCFAMAGMKVELSGGYSGWQPNVNSPLLAALKNAYNDMFGKQPDVRVIHAGLECGIISTNYPKMDMVSFGPTLMSPHSPTERVEIPTVEKFYSLVKALVVNGVL
jgi:di/tripeptidase